MYTRYNEGALSWSWPACVYDVLLDVQCTRRGLRPAVDIRPCLRPAIAVHLLPTDLAHLPIHTAITTASPDYAAIMLLVVWLS